MKRTLSIILVAVMLVSAVMFSVPTSAAEHTYESADALYFTAAPSIDGIITEQEWGASTVTVTSDANTVYDHTQYARFLYWEVGEVGDYAALAYTIWLRWDENYFYIGVKVNDPDGHSLKHGTSETWNGDAVQTRIDELGANYVTGGEDFAVTDDIKKPWSSPNIPDFVFGYCEIAGGFSEAWENSALGTNPNSPGSGMTAFSNNPLGVVKCAVAPSGLKVGDAPYSSDTANGISTYEIAIPWTYIFVQERDNPSPKNLATLTYEQYKGGRNAKNEGIGRKLGMSLVVLDAPSGANKYHAFLTWGSGICHAQWEEAPDTCTGSNQVTLSGTQVTPGAGYSQKDPTYLLDAKFDETVISKEVNKFYDYLSGDTAKANASANANGFKVLTYDDPNDQAYWGANDPAGKIMNGGDDHGNVLYYPNDVVQTYICTSDNVMDYTYPLSYTFQCDIKYTGNEPQTGVEGYDPAIYNWFGGAGGYSFQCGYYFNDGTFEIVNDSTHEILYRYNGGYNFQKDHWYTWRFQYDNNACCARLFIDDLATQDDNGPDTDNQPQEWGTMIFNTHWRYYYYSDVKHLADGAMILWRQMNTQVQYDNVKIYNFGSYKLIELPDEITTSGSNKGNGSGTAQKATGSVDVSKMYFNEEDGLWHLPVPVDQKYLTATSLVYTIGFNSENAALEGVKGLNDGTYTLEKKTDGSYLLTITDFTQVKAMKAGDTYFEMLFKPLKDGLKAEDLGVNATWIVQYMPATGDGVIYMVLAAAIMSIGCAVVIKKRKDAVQ